MGRVRLDLGGSQWFYISLTYCRVKCRAIVSIMGWWRGGRASCFGMSQPTTPILVTRARLEDLDGVVEESQGLTIATD